MSELSKLLSARLGIIFASLALIISIFAMMMLNGSVAWFASNENVGASGFKVSVDPGGLVSATLESYPVTDINTDTGEYEISYAEQSYVIPTDDPNGISYSAYKKALLVVITVEAHEDVNLEIDITATTALGDDIAAPDNFISNCISVSSATLNADGSIATRGADTASFLDVSGDSPTKTGIIKHAYPGLDAGVYKYCFIIEYDRELLTYLGNKLLADHPGKQEITYSDDIEFLVHALE